MIRVKRLMIDVKKSMIRVKESMIDVFSNGESLEMKFLKRVSTATIAQVALSLFLFSTSVCAQKVPVPYFPTSDDFGNPERGLFAYDDDREGNQEPLDEADLKARRITRNQTVVYRHYTLVKFQQSPLSDQYLTFLKEDASIA